MPMKSQSQRAYLHIHHPGIAKRFEAHTTKGKKLPKHVSRKKTAAAETPVTSDSFKKHKACGKINMHCECADRDDYCRDCGHCVCICGEKGAAALPIGGSLAGLALAGLLAKKVLWPGAKKVVGGLDTLAGHTVGSPAEGIRNLIGDMAGSAATRAAGSHLAGVGEKVRGFLGMQSGSRLGNQVAGGAAYGLGGLGALGLAGGAVGLGYGLGRHLSGDQSVIEKGAAGLDNTAMAANNPKLSQTAANVSFGPAKPPAAPKPTAANSKLAPAASNISFGPVAPPVASAPQSKLSPTAAAVGGNTVAQARPQTPAPAGPQSPAGGLASAYQRTGQMPSGSFNSKPYGMMNPAERQASMARLYEANGMKAAYDMSGKKENTYEGAVTDDPDRSHPPMQEVAKILHHAAHGGDTKDDNNPGESGHEEASDVSGESGAKDSAGAPDGNAGMAAAHPAATGSHLVDKSASEKRDAWKVGFLTKLAEDGVMPTEFSARVKSALIGDIAEGVTDVGKGAVGALTGMVGPAFKTLGLTALLAPPLLGAAAGAGTALMDSPSGEDIDMLRKAEILATLRKATRDVHIRKRLREVSSI